MEKFTREPATLRRIAEHYYVLDYRVGEIGATSRARLERWARIHGFAVTAFEDVRPRQLKAEVFPLF